MKQSKVMAACGMMAAMSIVVMLLGAVLEIGMYAAPMFAGLCLLPIGYNYGRKYQVILWIAVSLLSLILVPNVEEDLMYLCVFGCYPILRPWLQRLPKGLRILTKMLYFNLTVILLELLILWVLVPEPMESGFVLVLLLLGNVTFWCYDLVLPRAEKKLGTHLNKILP